MVGQIIDGKAIALSIRNQIKNLISEKVANSSRPPGLAVILVGNDEASMLYVKNKRMACCDAGIRSFYHHLPDMITEAELIDLVRRLNKDSNVDGILIQAPLPKHLDTNKIFEEILPEKDVDGFHPYNFGRLAQRRPLLRPCTPYGIMVLLHHIHEQFKGNHAVVVGASNIVGRPMAFELLIAGATVTICHRFTKDLANYVKDADILVSAVGKASFIQGHWIKENATVIDVGQNRLPDGKLVGDVDFESAKERAAYITPVPGGVGPMTVTVLLHNTLIAANYFENPLDVLI